jgi:hypothetical protein
MPVATTNEQPAQVMQGIAVPATSVNAPAFYAATRRQMVQFASNRSFGGFGSTDLVVALQTGIISGLSVRMWGTVTTSKSTGTVATTQSWPYGLLKAARFTANGQSNLINAGGIWLKAREAMRDALSDRGVRKQAGVAQPVANTPGNVGQGTLSMSNELWGTTPGGLELGSGVSGVADGTYAFDLYVYVPVCFDEVTLVGSIFAQTQATELALYLDWAMQSVGVPAGVGELFALTGAAQLTGFTCNYTVEGVVYDIPQVGGQIVVPDLSLFHQFVQTRNQGPAIGENEYMLPGQGVGKQLMRVGLRTMTGAPPTAVPLSGPPGALPYGPVAPNYGPVGWRYGGNITPEIFTDGRHLAQYNERMFGTDFSSLFGIGWLDFASQNALRDSVNEGTATQLRIFYNLGAGLTLSSPYTEVVQETLFGAAAGG